MLRSASTSGSARRRASASHSRALRSNANSMCDRSFGPVGLQAGVLGQLAKIDVGLAQQHGVTSAPLHVLPPVVEDREVHRTGIDVGFDLLEDERRGIDPEPGGAQLEPEPHDPA